MSTVYGNKMRENIMPLQNVILSPHGDNPIMAFL